MGVFLLTFNVLYTAIKNNPFIVIKDRQHDIRYSGKIDSLDFEHYYPLAHKEITSIYVQPVNDTMTIILD